MKISLNLLMILGIGLLCMGIITLVPGSEIFVLLGVALATLGIGLKKQACRCWTLAAFFALLFGAAFIASAMAGYITNLQLLLLIATAVFFAIGRLSETKTLIVLAIIMSASVLGMWDISPLSLYSGLNADFFLGVESVAFATIVFGLIAFLMPKLTCRLKDGCKRINAVVYRTAFVLMNYGLLSGSLSGDTIGTVDILGDYNIYLNVQNYATNGFIPRMVEGVFVIPSYFYLVITLIVFAVVGFFAMKKHLCFRIHAIGIFFAILFFIKWFTYLGTEYWSLLIAGAVAIAGAVYFMKEMKKMSCGMKTVTAPIAKKVATAPIKKTAIKKTNKKVPTKKPVKKTIKKKTTKK